MSRVEAKVAAIYTSPDKGLPMQSQNYVAAEAGNGLIGDRYAEGKGAFSQSKKPKIRHVSLISQEAIADVNAEHGTSFTAADTRRNIITTGVDLNDLVGSEFSVGGVKMKGVELCDPCVRPSNLAKQANLDGREGFGTLFAGRGGLRAEIIESGEITVGAPIETDTQR